MTEEIIKERVKRIKEINEFLKDIDVTIRPAAFVLLQDYIIVPASDDQAKNGKAKMINSGDREAFFLKYSHKKPAENILVLCAYHFSQYGSSPFASDEIKTLASEVGVTIPTHPAMTIKAAQRKGKNLFQIVDRGLYAPTVHGEGFFRETYEVSKGTMQKPQQETAKPKAD